MTMPAANMPPEKTRQIFIYDDLHPEDGAMLQALYSRSPDSVVNHLEKVRGAGSGNFMSKFYVGYGHASIGDCGVTNIFIENVSMLACKAIQDNPLYSGQEASTRYLDFSVQPMVDPYDHPYTSAILNKWMELYNVWLERVKAALAERYPYDPAEYKNEKIWQNAVFARAFDTMRAYLPVGTTTLLSWTTNLRQARDRLMVLADHPLPEVREMARDLFAQIAEKYPNSFNGQELNEQAERYKARHDYYHKFAEADHYQSYEEIQKRFGLSPEEQHGLEKGDLIARRNMIDIEATNRLEQAALKERPERAALARRLAAYGSYNLLFTLDFGSFRDIQRHRNGLCPLPLIDGKLGMFPWYMDELKDLLGEDFAALEAETQEQLDKIANLKQAGIDPDPLRSQYLYPMGISIVCNVTYSLPQMVYVSELRSGKPVHPSLRPVAQKMGRLLEQDFPGIAQYVDYDADSWTAKRGEQTIMAKE